MGQKNNIRSIRFSDELADLIDRQVGRTFTQKFENLVTRCVWELPQKEEEIKRLDQLISKKTHQLYDMSVKLNRLERSLQELQRNTNQFKTTLQNLAQEWEA